MDPNMFTTPFQLTKSLQRDVYPAVDPTNPSLRVEGKVVIVSGAGGGLGSAIAKAWSNAGAKGVVLVGRDPKKLESIATTLQGPYLVVPTDITVEDNVKTLFSKSVENFGGVDVVINAAGITSLGQIGDVEPSSWWKDYEINVKATYHLAHHFIKTNGGKGTFINTVTLGAAMLAPGGMSAYSSSQLAAVKLGEYLDLEQPDLRVFSVHPGIVQAEEGRGATIAAFDAFAKDKQALTAGVTLYLQKPEADFLRGGFYSVNWDVNELSKHQKEVTEGKLLKLAFLNGKLGTEGHPWAQ